jgi:hypothetical protein
MTLYALEALDDALDATRAFLRPRDRTDWVKLAIVVFFLGGVGGNTPLQYTTGGDGGTGGTPSGGMPIEFGPRVWLLVAAVVAAVVLVALVFGLIGSIMEFVFVECLREETVAVRRFWSRRWRQGVRLFAFRIAIGLLVLGGVAVLLLPVLAPLFDVGPFGGVGGGVSIALLVLLVPVFVLFALIAGLVEAFTTAFVVPIMILEDRNVLPAWRRLWSTITAQWQQYLAYAVAAFLLGLVGGLLVGIGVLIGAVVLLAPFGLLAAIGVALYVLVSELAGIVVVAVVAFAYFLAVLALAALVQVPVLTYLRYYALLVLGDVDPDLDLIAERRAAIRAADDADGDGGGDGGDDPPTAA